MAKVHKKPNTDPVCFNKAKQEWGFWDESWSVWYGGFLTRRAANKGLKKYVKEVLR